MSNPVGLNAAIPINLNVGGTIYTTSRLTLTSYPDSMLARMFDGDIPTARDAHGNFFIDRDGQLFRYVLNFLRTSKLYLPEGMVDLQNLKDEADFYQILHLHEIIVDEIKKRQQESLSPLVPHVDYMTGYFLEVIEHNKLKTCTKSIQIIGHLEVIKVLPLTPDDFYMLQVLIDAAQQVSCYPLRSSTGYMWYLGKNIFELQEISYMTRVEIGEIARVYGGKLVSHSASYSNSTETSNLETLLILEKWHISEFCLQRLREKSLAQKALPPGRTVGFIDWTPANL